MSVSKSLTHSVLGYSGLAIWLTVALKNVAPELAGIAIGVLVIDVLNEKRQNEQLKEQLIRQFGSDIRGVAVPASVELASKGWMFDGSLNDKMFYGPNLTNVHFKGAKLKNVWLKNANLEGSTFSESHFEKANLDESHFEGANLSKSHFEGALTRGTHFEEADLSEAHFEVAEMRGVHLEKANLDGTFFNGANLEWAHLDDVDLRKTHLDGADLRNAHLKRTNLKEVKLTGTSQSISINEGGLGVNTINREGVKLEGADFTQANLVGIRLKGTDLSRVKFIKSDLLSARLENTKLIKTKFDDADLYATHFEEADLKGASFNGAKMTRVHLEGAVNLTDQQLLSAKTLDGATMQDGTKLKHINGNPPYLDGPTLEQWIDTKPDCIILTTEENRSIGVDELMAELNEEILENEDE